MVSGGCSHSWRIASSWQQFAMWKVRGCRIRRAERSLSRLRRYGRSGAGHSTFKIRSTRGLSEPRKRFEGQRQRFALQAYPETMTRNVESPAMRPSPEQRASPRGVTRLVRSMNMAGVCRNGRRPAQRRRRLARDGRHFASRFGLTTHEHSSGSTRKLRRIARPGAPAAERPRLQ